MREVPAKPRDGGASPSFVVRLLDGGGNIRGNTSSETSAREAGPGLFESYAASTVSKPI
jgi:hypothetical protein